MKHKIIPLLLVVFAVVASSCGRPTYVVASRPARPVYTRPLAPGPNYVWVDGNYVWRGGRYEYTNGYWIEPRAGRWQNGHWKKVRGGYTWVPGRWR